MKKKSCKKCGHGEIAGPTYSKGTPLHAESLRYMCRQCGYGWTTPTLDRPRKHSW